MKNWGEWVFYVSVGVGMALATSAFTMISGFFASAGTEWILAGVALAGLFSLCVSLSIGELAGMFPSAPGVRTYFKVAFGHRPSLVLVYMYLAFVVLIAGLESFVFSQVVATVFPGLPLSLILLALLGSVVAINIVGYQLPRTAQILTTVGAVILVVGAGVWGLASARPEAAGFGTMPFSEGALKLPLLIGMGIFLYTGFEWVTPLGASPKAYEWRVPFSMQLTVVTLAAAYSLFIAGAASRLTAQAIAQTPVPQVPYFFSLFGSGGGSVALGLSVLAIFSTFNAGLLGGSQLIFVLAREGHLPAWCARTSERSGSPIGAILLLGSLTGISSAIVLNFRLEIMAALLGAAIMCIVYAAFVVSTCRLRSLRPQARRPFRSPLPSAVQMAIAVVLLGIGIATLWSEPGKGPAGLAALFATGIIAFLLSTSDKPAEPVPAARAAGGGAGAT